MQREFSDTFREVGEVVDIITVKLITKKNEGLIMSKLDADKSGKIDAVEVISYVKSLADVNKDGLIDVKDFLVLKEKVVSKLDTNGDGKVSSSELKTGIKKTKSFWIDVLLVVGVVTIIMYCFYGNQMVELMITGDTLYWNKCITFAMFISTILGLKEKYEKKIKEWMKISVDDKKTISDKEKEIDKLNKVISNSSFESEKKLLLAEVTALKEERDALITNLANSKAIIEVTKPKS